MHDRDHGAYSKQVSNQHRKAVNVYTKPSICRILESILQQDKNNMLYTITLTFCFLEKYFDKKITIEATSNQAAGTYGSEDLE